MRVLIMRLEAPLMAFGREMIDSTGPTRDDPDMSLVTGLLANALGYRRSETARHQTLQDRLRMAVRLDRPGVEMLDYQIAVLFEDEEGWTTRGAPEGRKNSPSYRANSTGRRQLSHQRYRYYRADASLTIALGLDDPEAAPSSKSRLSDCRAGASVVYRPEIVSACDPTSRWVSSRRRRCSTPRLRPPSTAASDIVIFSLAADSAEADPSRAHGSEEQGRTVRRDWIAGVHAGQETRIVATLDRAPS